MLKLHLNTDKSFLREINRVAAPISLEDFRAKITKIQSGITLSMGIGELEEVWPPLQKDLGVVQFDFENEDDTDFFGPVEGSLHGWQAFDNQFVFKGMHAFGDWEAPVFFILYWDGESVRAYVPLLGNLWNPHTGMALGNGVGDYEDYLSPGFKDDDTLFLEKEYGAPLPKDFDYLGNLGFDYALLRYDIERTFTIQ